MSANHPCVAFERLKLEAQGADPEYFISEGVPLALMISAGNDALFQTCVEQLGKYALQLHQSGFELWNPFRFGLRPIKKIKALELSQLLLILEIQKKILASLQRHSLDYVMSFQKGLQWLPEFVDFDFAFYIEFLQSAARLAETGVDPARFLELNAKACKALAKNDLSEFIKICDGFEKIILAIDERGLGYVYPFALGLQMIAMSYVGDSADFLKSLPTFLELIDLLRSHNHSPYGTFEYGLATAFGGAQSEEDRNLIIDCALALATAGVNPQGTLQLALPNVLNAPVEHRELMRKLLVSLVQKGIPSDAFFENCYFVFLENQSPAQTLEYFTKIEDLFVLAQATPHFNFYRLFRDGFWPLLYERTFSRHQSLDLAKACIEKGFDAASILNHGVSSFFVRFENEPDLITGVLKLTFIQIENGINPMALLATGSKIAKDFGRNDPEMALEIFQSLHEFILDLSPDSKNPEKLFAYGLQSSANNLGPNPGILLKLIRQLREKTLELQRDGLNAENALYQILSTNILDTRSDLVMEVGSSLSLKLSKLPFDSTPLISELLPTLLAQSESGPQALELYELIYQLVLKDEAVQDFDDVRRVLSELRLRAEVAGMKRERFLNLLQMLQSLEHSCAVNRVLIECVFLQLTKTLNQPGPAEDSLVSQSEAEILADLFAILKAIPLGTLSSEDQKVFCQTLLPAALASSRTRLADVKKSMDSLLQLTFLIPKSLDLMEVTTLLSCIAERCDSLAQFVLEISQLDLALLTRSDFANLPFGFLAKQISEASKTRAELLQNFEGFLKIADPVFLAPQRLATFFKNGLPLLIQISNFKGYNFLDCFRTAHQLAKFEFDSDPRALVFSDLSSIHSLLTKLPSAWRELINPLPSSQGKGAMTILRYYRWMDSYIESESDLNFLKVLITQMGVRTPDILGSLIYPLLYNKKIESLSSERGTLWDFINEISINDPDLFIQYRSIIKDESLNEEDKKNKVRSLQEEFAKITAAIVQGVVPKELEEKDSFFKLLYYVFSPSYSMDYRAYENLYRRFPDYTDQVKRRSQGDQIPETTFDFSEGGYVLRTGESIQTQAWNFVLSALTHADTLTEDLTLLGLGQSLFKSWIQSEFSPENRIKITGMICRHYKQGHEDLPRDLENTHNLLKLKSFVEDSAQEVIHAALGELFRAEPTQFLNQAQHKIIPIKTPGKGLVKNVQNTVRDYKAQRVDRTAAEKRIRIQLRGFAGLEDPLIHSLLGSEEEKIPAILGQLKTEEKDCDPGQVYLRVYSDLLGEVAAQMKKELFGDQNTPAKIEFKKSIGGEVLNVRFQVTKRRAHAPVGFCEGVCTAQDLQLWENPHFMQVVFWGPGDRAFGGMHILLAPIGDKIFLTLPGINPTLTFLKRVRAQEVFDRCIDFSKGLVKLWKLDGLWIPENPGIHSNRLEIQNVIKDKKLPLKTVPNIQFSYSPYSYSFNGVFDASEHCE